MNELIKNKKKSEILAEELNKLTYGDFISHAQISTVIEEAYGTNRYTSTIAKTKKILLKKYNKAIQNIVGDGYRVVTPDDFVQQSLKHYKRGFNEMQKGYDHLDNAPTKDMSQEGLNTYRRVYDRAVILKASMVGVRAELKSLAKKEHPFDPKYVGKC